MKKVKIIGLTGQSGAGKSTVAGIFEQNGFAVINADSLVTRVYGQNKYYLNAVAAYFGSDIINSDGTLDRKLLAKRAFSSKENTRALGGIVHPFVLSEFLNELKAVNGYAVFDAPQLFESGIDVICDVIVSVVAEEKIRLERIMNRDGITESEARQRINAQLSEEFFRANSDYIIENSTDGGLEQKTLELIAVIKSR